MKRQILVAARRTLGPFVVILQAVLWASHADAAIIIEIDPGSVGDTFQKRTFNFTDINGTVPLGQQIDLDFVFSDMKGVETDFFHRRGNLTTFNSFSLRLFFNTTDYPPFFVDSSGFLSDDFGDPIGNVAASGLFRTNGLSAFSFQHSFSVDDPSANGLIFHDVHYNITLFDAPNLQVTGGSLKFDFFSNGEFTVVPEPTTLVLMGLGLAGIGFARQKKQNLERQRKL